MNVSQKAMGDSDGGPVFIVGCQRSGTSAVWRALRQHTHFRPKQAEENDLPEAWDKELWYIYEFVKGRKNDPPAQHHEWGVDSDYKKEFVRFVSDFISRRHGGPKGRWISACPRDALYIEEILEMFSSGTAIFLMRHPQEVIWSSLHAPWQKTMSREGFLYQTRQGARHWNRCAKACKDATEALCKERVLVIQNDELRKTPKRVLQKICHHINIPNEDVVLHTLLSGAYHSFFLKENGPLHRISNVHKHIISDHEFCDVVAEESSFWMRECGYRDLREDGHKYSSSATSAEDLLANEQYWRKQLTWYEEEIARRKRTSPLYTHQEIYLGEYFRRYAGSVKPQEGENPRVLEFGFGFGRHLRYLMNISGIEFFGCDISPQSIHNATNWAHKEWIERNLKEIDPRSTLPYPDKWFDIVFTVSVLIHIRPENLESIIKELIRVCRGHLLHIENPMADRTHVTSTMHDGCWAHSIRREYQQLGLSVDMLPGFTEAQSIYRVVVDHDDTLPEVPQHIVSNMLLLEGTVGDEVKVQKKAIHQLDNKVQYLHNELLRSQSNLQQMRRRYNDLENSRAIRIQRWLASQPRLNAALQSIYDKSAHMYKRKEHSVTSRRLFSGHSPELKIGDGSIKLLSVCHPMWKGMRSAAEGQSPNILLLPESSKAEIDQAVDLIRPHDPSYVILNGFFPGYDEFAYAIRKNLSNTRVYYVHHGSFYQMQEDRKLPRIVSRMISLCREGVIERIGFVKHGMSQVFEQFGIEASLVLNRVSQTRPKYQHSWSRPIRVFVPVTDHLRKNLHTQLLACLMIGEIDEVHIIGPVDIAYLENSNAPIERLVVHSKLSRDGVLDLIDRSTMVLYVTISECAPVVPLESFAAGVPCLSGANHGLLTDDPFLEKMLVVDHEDDPVHIADAILRIKGHYNEICQAISQFTQVYEKRAIESLHNFLGIEGD